jgi:hypothetical protein
MEKVDRIGTVFPKNKLTLVLALPGSGKTTTTLKALIADNIVPIWFNLDYSDTTANKDKIEQFDDTYLMDLLLLKIEDVKDRVILIDTYERLEEVVIHYLIDSKTPLPKDEVKRYIVNKLEELADSGVTVIVLAHPEDYVGRDGIFNDNIFLPRRAYEVISMETKLSTSTQVLKGEKKLKGTNKLEESTSYFTHIKKGRAYDGPRVIHNWMRD